MNETASRAVACLDSITRFAADIQDQLERGQPIEPYTLTDLQRVESQINDILTHLQQPES